MQFCSRVSQRSPHECSASGVHGSVTLGCSVADIDKGSLGLEDMQARSGSYLSGVPPFSQDPQPWSSICEKWFRSMGAVRFHAVTTHGKRDQLRVFVLSAACLACLKVFASGA